MTYRFSLPLVSLARGRGSLLVLHPGTGLLFVTAHVRLCGCQAKSECDFQGCTFPLTHTQAHTQLKNSEQHPAAFCIAPSAFPLILCLRWSSLKHLVFWCFVRRSPNVVFLLHDYT